MTKSQACQPCAKRKIRCDHGVPCSNCKRQKTSHCTYPTVSPQDRINQLEALVKELRDDALAKSERSYPDGHTGSGNWRVDSHASNDDFLLLSTLQSQFHGQQVSNAKDIRRTGPVELEESGRSFNPESKTAQDPVLRGTEQFNLNRIYLPSDFPDLPHALATSQASANLVNGTLCQQYPTVEYANILWDMFMDRVDPMVRVCYKWWLGDFREKALNVEICRELSVAEHALLSAIYLISIVSMSNQECETLLHQPRKRLLQDHERISVEALQRTNLFCMNNTVVMQAVIIYLVAGYNRLSTQSLWSLTGLAIRSAEKLGMHRDGIVSDLSPCQIEERRRIWWQLQQGDLAMGIRTGVMSMTLTADWDVGLPLNIEDEDISAASTEFPPQRKGLTSMSLFRYYCFTLSQQRKAFHANQKRRAQMLESRQSVQPALKGSMIEQLEEGLNEEFLRFCDPIKPLHVLIQILARYIIASMRLRTLHAEAYENKKENDEHELHTALIDIAMQCLEYRIASQSHPMLQKYRWMTGEWVPFQAFMLVLVEAVQEGNPDKSQKIWDLLSQAYDDSSNLWSLWEDRRKYQFAQLVVIAWKTWQRRHGTSLRLSNPGFVEQLERELVKPRPAQSEDMLYDPLQPHAEAITSIPDNFGADREENDTVFDMEFQDIDWSFWDSID